MSWSAPPRASSRWRGVLITIGTVALWLVLFIVAVSPILLDLWRGRSVPSSTVDSSQSPSSASHSSSLEIK